MDEMMAGQVYNVSRYIREKGFISLGFYNNVFAIFHKTSF